MSMARRTFPSRLELNRPEGSFNAAPLANVILTTFLCVSPVQTMPAWEKTGVPGDVGLTHLRSSRISGSASCMVSRTFASVFPRQSPSSLILSSMKVEPVDLFMFNSNSRSYFGFAQRNLQPPQAELALQVLLIRFITALRPSEIPSNKPESATCLRNCSLIPPAVACAFTKD